jgi:hypothetical protein
MTLQSSDMRRSLPSPDPHGSSAPVSSTVSTGVAGLVGRGRGLRPKATGGEQCTQALAGSAQRIHFHRAPTVPIFLWRGMGPT